MADQFGLFWNSINADRTYDADSFAEWLRKFFTTGVFNGEMQVTPDTGMAVSVSPGYANLNGKVRFFDAAQSFTLDPASGTYPRIDTIVVRSDSTNRVITTEYVKGAYSGNNPVPTAPVRTAGIYEIVLAQIYVGAGITAIIADDITDTRPDDDLCGWVTSTVESVPVDQIVTQMQAQFLTWFDEMKGQLSEDAAGHLQNQITNLRDSITFSGTSPATSPIYINNYFYYSPDETHLYLCKAIANIAIGDTLVRGTNYEVVTGNYIIGDINSRIGNTDISDIGNTITAAIFANNREVNEAKDDIQILQDSLTWRRVLNIETIANTNFDQTITTENISSAREVMLTIQRTSNGRTIASNVIPYSQFANGALYANGSYNLYSGEMRANANNWINAVAIWVSNTQIEVAVNGIPEALTVRVFVR